MNKMKRIGLGFLLALGLGACGSDDPGKDAAFSGGQDGSARWDTIIGSNDGPATSLDVALPPIDGGGVAIDTGVRPVDGGVAIDSGVLPIDGAGVAIDSDTEITPGPYVWVVIQDTEQKACTTNGPGADIDAVALWGNGAALAWGKVGSANYSPNGAGNACENADCSGGNCKYAAIGTTFDANTLVAYTEGPADAKVNETTNDSGYFSLNAGVLQLQLGDLTGAGPAREIKSGDKIRVFEVDQTYITSGNAYAQCVCAPEHYQVYVQAESGVSLKLKPTLLATDNAAACAALTATSVEGCGTTVFTVP